MNAYFVAESLSFEPSSRFNVATNEDNEAEYGYDVTMLLCDATEKRGIVAADECDVATVWYDVAEYRCIVASYRCSVATSGSNVAMNRCIVALMRYAVAAYPFRWRGVCGIVATFTLFAT